MDGSPLRRAVVIGGGVAGLLAARALAAHIPQVVLLERDRLPAEPGPRTGVPQARHAHVLLARGYRILRRFFPELDTDLAQAGVPTLCWTQDIAALLLGGWFPRFPSSIVGPSPSRDLLEWQIRRYVAALPGVTLLDRHRVTELLHRDGGRQVIGVKAVAPTGDTRTFSADLVVDASGRSSPLPAWLEALGHPPPAETRVNAHLAYASRWYRIPPRWRADWKVVLLTSRFPDIPRGAAILPVEGQRWVVTLAGIGGDCPPTDPEGFVAFAQSLIGPQVYQAIVDAEPLSPVYGYRRTENRWRHLERMPDWPGGLLAVGDAVCAFNPVYGQGITVAAMAAELLDQLLGQGSRDLERRFQRRLARLLRTPWTLATGEDLRWAGSLNQRPGILQRLFYAYLDRVGELIPQDVTVARTFVAINHLLASPWTLFSPQILARVARHVLRSPRSQVRRS